MVYISGKLFKYISIQPGFIIYRKPSNYKEIGETEAMSLICKVI
jgi:hypothetical protein